MRVSVDQTQFNSILPKLVPLSHATPAQLPDFSRPCRNLMSHNSVDAKVALLASQVIIAMEGQSLHVIPRPCWDKAICIPGVRSLERSRSESTVSSRNLFKDRTIHLLIP